MKEKEFIKVLKEMNFYDGLTIEVYYSIDDKGNVILDEEGIKKELEIRLNEMKEVLR